MKKFLCIALLLSTPVIVKALSEDDAALFPSVACNFQEIVEEMQTHGLFTDGKNKNMLKGIKNLCDRYKGITRKLTDAERTAYADKVRADLKDSETTALILLDDWSREIRNKLYTLSAKAKVNK